MQHGGFANPLLGLSRIKLALFASPFIWLKTLIDSCALLEDSLRSWDVSPTRRKLLSRLVLILKKHSKLLKSLKSRQVWRVRWEMKRIVGLETLSMTYPRQPFLIPRLVSFLRNK